MTTPAVTADTITRASDRLREAAALIADAARDAAGLGHYEAAASLMFCARDAVAWGRKLLDKKPLIPESLPQRPVHPAQVAQAALDPDSLPDGGVK